MLVWISLALAFALGCAIGWSRAGRRGGSRADQLQWALAHGIPLALATLAAIVVLARAYA